MSSSHAQWLLTTVNAVRELMIGRLAKAADPDAKRDVQMALEELDVMWEELQGQAELLTRENQRYAEFFDHAPDAYVVTDAGGNIREANRAACELLGASRAALSHRALGSFLAEQDRTTFLSHFVGLLVENVDKSAWQAELRPAAGAPLRVALSVRAIPLGKSAVGGLCWLIRRLD